MKNKKWLASFRRVHPKKRARQLQFVSYLSLLLNAVYTILFLLIILMLRM